MMKYYDTKHKNKFPAREMDTFRAGLFCIYFFFWLL